MKNRKKKHNSNPLLFHIELDLSSPFLLEILYVSFLVDSPAHSLVMSISQNFPQALPFHTN
jgi:hypothetical protein